MILKVLAIRSEQKQDSSPFIHKHNNNDLNDCAKNCYTFTQHFSETYTPPAKQYINFFPSSHITILSCKQLTEDNVLTFFKNLKLNYTTGPNRIPAFLTVLVCIFPYYLLFNLALTTWIFQSILLLQFLKKEIIVALKIITLLL